MTTKNEILLSYGYIEITPIQQRNDVLHDVRQSLGTFVANLAAYGFAPNVDALKVITQLNVVELGVVWRELEPAIKKITGADRKMADYVVYKNFPKEVLDMTGAQYWFNQICMYVGFPNEFFTQDVKERAPLDERLKLKVLHLAEIGALEVIFGQLIASKARWTDDQREHTKYLAVELALAHTNITDFGFKENGIDLIAHLALAPKLNLSRPFTVTIPDATDVLRLAVTLSDPEATLRDDVKFKSFPRPVRRFLVNALEHSKNLDADMAARADLFKKLLMRLHPGEFKAPRVQRAYDVLYKDEYQTFNSQVEAGLINRDIAVLDLLASRPGEYARRLHHLFKVFPEAQPMVADGLMAVADRLSTTQLLKLAGYLRTVNERNYFMYAPKGVWAKVQIAGNTKTRIPLNIVSGLRDQIRELIADRVNAHLPQGVEMVSEADLDAIKLQTNDQELAPYGRGTEFDIPANMTFLRSASYWKLGRTSTVWFDNGWNFFDENWKSVGMCSWDETKFHTDQTGDYDYGYSYSNRAERRAAREVAAVFSGDPTSAKTKGHGCQMIDLYLDKLERAGVRFAVWNILCYSKIPFSQAEDVLAVLQWGENAEAGELFEPARAQMVFPLKSENYTKYVAYVDVVKRKLVYMDANLPANVRSASSNTKSLEEKMPAFVEYLKAQPSVYDLFEGANTAKEGSVPILFSDEEVEINGGQAYVFQKRNANNSFEQLDLTKLLA